MPTSLPFLNATPNRCPSWIGLDTAAESDQVTTCASTREPVAEVIARIENERAAGRSLRAIAVGLNAERVPTAHGGRQWHASTVRAAIG